MAQVMVNFRLDEEIKKSMEQACREMGMSMSTAFTIFARKVGKEKRIPFEITAESQRPEPRPEMRPRRGPEQSRGEESLVLARKQERLELLCTAIRRSLTAVHTAIPASITGLCMERIRLLCRDELKDKAAGISNSARSLFSGRSALQEKDLSILDEYIDGLASIAQELLELEYTLIPAMKAWQGDGDDAFKPYEQRLAAVSQKLDGLPLVMQRFLCSTACKGGAHAVRARLRQCARTVETAYVLTALDSLESLILRHYDALEEQTRTRLEADYVQTLELTLRELGQAEQDGGDVGGKAALCLRVINVLSQVISENRQLQQEWRAWNVEAEVVALERLAVLRGDIAGGARPEV